MADITSLLPLVNASLGDGVYGATDPSGTPGDAIFDISSLGVWEYLGTAALTGATVDMTTVGGATHKILRLLVIDAVFDTSGVTLELQFKKASGIISSGYRWGNFRVTSGGSTGALNSASDTSIHLLDSQSISAGESCSGEVVFFDIQSALQKKVLYRFIGDATGSVLLAGQGGGEWTGGTDVLTGLRLLPSSGNFSGGNAYIWGLRI